MKVICFTRDGNRSIAGRYIPPKFANWQNGEGPPKKLLQWRFQQTVLANMRLAHPGITITTDDKEIRTRREQRWAERQEELEKAFAEFRSRLPEII